jgi:hypothetical protein
MNSRIKVLSSQFFRCTSPSFFHIANPRWEYHSTPPSPDLFCFLSNRFFDFERERQQLCQRVQFIYLHSSLSFFVPSYPRSLSLAGLNADGAHFFRDTSMGDGGTVADTSPPFSSTGQDESTSGAGAGVIQDITDAPEISFDRDFNDDVVNPAAWTRYQPLRTRTRILSRRP